MALATCPGVAAAVAGHQLKMLHGVAGVPHLCRIWLHLHPCPRRVHQWLHRVTVTSRMGSTRHSTTVITTASFLHLHTLQGAVLRSALQILLHTRGTAAERIALFWNSECCGSHVITAVLRFLGSDYHYPQHPRHCNNAIHDNNVTHLIWNCSSGCIEPTQYFYLLSTGNTHFILNSLVIVDDATRRTRTHSSHFSFNSLRSETKWLVD